MARVLENDLFRMALAVKLRLESTADFADSNPLKYKISYRELSPLGHWFRCEPVRGGPTWGRSYPRPRSKGRSSKEPQALVKQLLVRREHVEGLPPQLEFTFTKPLVVKQEQDGTLLMCLPLTLRPPVMKSQYPRRKKSPASSSPQLILPQEPASQSGWTAPPPQPVSPKTRSVPRRPILGVRELVRMINLHKELSGDLLVLDVNPQGRLVALEQHG